MPLKTFRLTLKPVTTKERMDPTLSCWLAYWCSVQNGLAVSAEQGRPGLAGLGSWGAPTVGCEEESTAKEGLALWLEKPCVK